MVVVIAICCLLGIISAILLLKKTKYTKRQKKIIVMLIALLMAIIAFHVKPHDWDIQRHFIWMNEIRSSNLTLFKLLFNNPLGIGGYTYRTLITFNLIRYIICQLTENNHWLPCICTFIDYLIVGYIVFDWYDICDSGNRISLITVLLCGSLLSPFFIFTGVRASMASCIMALAIYQYICKKKSIISFILLSFAAITIHQVVLFAIPFVFLSKFEIGKKGLIIVGIVSLSLNTIARLFLKSNILFLSTIAKAYLLYTSENQYFGSRYELWSDLIIVGTFVLLYFIFGEQFKKKLFTNNEQKNLYVFLLYYMCFILGNIGNYDLVVRPCYLLGVFAPVLATIIDSKLVWRGFHARILQILGRTLCVLLCTYTIYKHLYPLYEFNALL